MHKRRLFFAIFLLFGLQLCLADIPTGDSLIVVSGVVKEAVHKKKLPETSITVPGSNIGTVTNADGFFSLKIPQELLGAGIKAEHLGYTSAITDGSRLTADPTGLTIWLEPAAKMLEEVMVYGAEPRSLVEKAIRKIPENYSSSSNMFTSFYREIVQKGRRYVGVSEAMVNVLKKPYISRQIYGDKVQVLKGRRLVSQRSSDTLAVKIVGGPAMPIILDVVKNEDALFSLKELDYYEFRMEPATYIDDRPQFVVSFRPKVKVSYALNKGTAYIDRETQAFTRLEYSLDVSDKEKATRAILFKKPSGLRFKPQEVEFTVTYKYQNGVSYLNYIRSKMRFKCDWKRRLFSSGYTTYAEMVMVDRNDTQGASIPYKEAFGQRDIFYDMVDNFSDDNFWKDYNIIEPTESLEKAVTKLKKKK